MFYPFSKKLPLNNLDPVVVWKIQTLLYGVMLSLLDSEEDYHFPKFLRFFSDVIEQDKSLLTDIEGLNCRIGLEAGSAYDFFHANKGENVSQAASTWRPSSDEIISYLNQYPSLKAELTKT